MPKKKEVEYTVSSTDESKVIYCPIYISTNQHKKMFVVQSKPEHKIWLKDKEITTEELVEILNKIK